MKFHTIAPRILSLLAVCMFCMTSCIFYNYELSDPEVFNRVNILYSAGHNDLTEFLKDDINELAESAVQHWHHPYDALIVFSHQAIRKGDYRSTEPEITRVREKDGKPFFETLLKFPKETVSADADTFREVMTYIKENFPAREYNLIFSSHCSGYLPEGYLGNSEYMERSYGSGTLQPHRVQKAGAPQVYPAPEYNYGPLTKGIGADYIGSSSRAIEMNLGDFAEAIPEMPLNAIIFDACFMGGIEVAYELKGKCSHLIASPAEVLADGMVYTAMGKRIFGGKTDLQGLCEDFYNHYYDIGHFRENGGIISMIDCRNLEPLAVLCRELFERYRDPQSSTLTADHNDVQRFYRNYTGHYHGFYDFRDIMANSGCSEDDMARLDAAIEKCVVYKASTPSFLTSHGGFSVTSHCGFSMYLPSHTGTYGNAYLNDYYKGLAWNKATGLVK